MIADIFKLKLHILRTATALAVLMLAISCSDDPIYDPSYIGDGEAVINAELTFQQQQGNLNTRAGEDSGVSGGTDGNVIGNIESICVLLYKNGELFEKYPQDALKDFSYSENSKLPDDFAGDASHESENTNENNNPHQAEQTTQKVTFKIEGVPFGKYHMYAVANMGDLEEYNENIKKEDGLREINLYWQADVKNNNKMFGYFTEYGEDESSSGFVAKDLLVNKESTSFHAWLKRTVSKVTVAFDARKLKSNIKIYIKSVEIKDIPNSCFLGADNPGTPDNDNGNTEVTFASQSQAIYYNTGLEGTPNIDWTQYLSNTKGDPGHLVLGADPAAINPSQSVDEQIESQHGENTKSLFFFENLQGKGTEGTMSDKRQQVKGDNNAINNKLPSYPDGVNEDDPAWKDAKRYGSYIEVKAYYVSKNADCLGQGDITYRFMLGRDVVTDYNAYRNYHYKLTLCFNGYANDIDWHIDYNPIPDIYVPDPYYISYMKDASMELPIHVTGTLKEGSNLKLEVIDNNWIPIPNTENPSDVYYNAFWNPQNKDLLKLDTEGFGGGPYCPTTDQYNATTGPQNIYGVISLADPSVPGNDAWNKRGVREFTTTPGTYDGYLEDGYKYGGYKGFKVEKKDKYTTTFKIPLYALEFNYYVAYRRKAKIKITGTFIVDGIEKEVSKTLDMIQVHHLVNPTGIWRDWNETNSFDVHLLDLRQDYTINPWTDPARYEKFTSDGPWFAEIMVQGGDDGSDWIELSGLDDSYKKNNRIYGDDGSTIDFKFAPKSALSSSDKVRYGIIRVRYNNYTCEHLIFVRQGYAPLSINDNSNQAKWYTFNMRTQNALAESPCEEGSTFKRCRWDFPIDPTNNKIQSFKIAPGPLLIYGTGESKLWDSWYTIFPAGSAGGNAAELNKQRWEKPGISKMRVPTFEDYQNLIDNSLLAIGVMYDNKATGVQYPVKDAYCYYYDYTNGADGNGNGMRGTFIYDKGTGRQLFFPIGASGYGRRKGSQFWYVGPFTPGMLMYASRNNYMDVAAVNGRVFLFDIFRYEGSLYWLEDRTHSESGSIKGAFDVNYHNIKKEAMNLTDVASTYNSTGEKSDAIFMRCVVDESSN